MACESAPQCRWLRSVRRCAGTAAPATGPGPAGPGPGASVSVPASGGHAGLGLGCGGPGRGWHDTTGAIIGRASGPARAASGYYYEVLYMISGLRYYSGRMRPVVIFIRYSASPTRSGVPTSTYGGLQVSVKIQGRLPRSAGYSPRSAAGRYGQCDTGHRKQLQPRADTSLVSDRAPSPCAHSKPTLPCGCRGSGH